MTTGDTMTTIAERLLARQHDDSPFLLHENGTWSFRQVVEEGQRRAALYRDLHRTGTPPHIGVLLDNAPDYIFWLVAAALSGSVIVGINSTYRGAQLAQLIEHSDCDVLVTSSNFLSLLDGAATSLSDDHIVLIDDPDHAARLTAAAPWLGPAQLISPDDLMLLVFTSGSTGLPKAVRCTQGRLARTGGHVAGVAALGPGDVVYSPLPFFHSSSLFTGWSSALAAGVPIGTRTKFSASRTISDIRRYGATMLTYTGKVLNYILAVPEAADDADTPLRLAIGNEASESDIRTFSRRFGCTVRDSYGSTEGVIIIRRDEGMPPGSLGLAGPTVKVINPDTGLECPPAQYDTNGRVVTLKRASARSSRPNRCRVSRATTRTRRQRRSASEAARTGQATSPTATQTVGSTSPVARTSGCASTERTSLPRRSRRSSPAIPQFVPSRCTPYPTTPWETG